MNHRVDLALAAAAGLVGGLLLSSASKDASAEYPLAPSCRVESTSTSRGLPESGTSWSNTTLYYGECRFMGYE